jgi:hypothetical protein
VKSKTGTNPIAKRTAVFLLIGDLLSTAIVSLVGAQQQVKMVKI